MGFSMPLENFRTFKAHDPLGDTDASADLQVGNAHPLDSPQSIRKLNRLLDWWHQARQAQAEARREMALDEDFYDGLQWREDDKRVLEERGQMPLVINKIKPTIDWVIGTETRTKIDFRVYGRGEEDVEPAEVKTKLLKYLSDVNRGPYHRSQAFKDCVIAGIGWLEDGIRSDESDEPLYSRYENWRNMWYDPLSVERDLSDARFLFRSKWVDLDIAVAIWPDRKSILECSARSQRYRVQENDEYFWLADSTTNETTITPTPVYLEDAFSIDLRRERVRLIEAWYREPERVQVMRGNPAFRGLIYDPENPFMNRAVKRGVASVYDAVKLLVWQAIFCDSGLLQIARSPYRHNRFPFTPIWCYRRRRDNTPYGIVRNLRDPQEDLNKRRSKALFLLSTNKMIADWNAFENWDEAIEEKDRPDGVLKKRPGADVALHTETQLAEEHVMLMRDDAQFIQDVSGVTDENLGRQTNAVSGRAILARQDQGTTATAEPFENLRLACQLEGEIQTSLIEQFYDEPKVVRLTEDPKAAEFLKINQWDEETGAILNDITASQADFVVDAQDFRESVRTAMFESLMELMGKLPPETVIQMLDLVIDLSDLPQRKELVRRIREINGQIDEKERDTPEYQEKIKAQEEEAARQKELEERTATAEAKVKEAQAEKARAEAEKAHVEKMGTALQVARETVSAPEIATAADSLIESAKAS